MDRNKMKLISIGIITGFINGIFGSGGGVIVVPALILLVGMDDHKAHATAISIILPLSIISTIIYSLKSSIPIKVAIPISIGGVLGGYIGAKTLNKIPAELLRKIFGGVIIYTAIRMIWK